MIIDKLLNNKGYILREENEYGAVYEKYIAEHDYVHVIDIMEKQSGNHIVQSYDKFVHKIHREGYEGTYYMNEVCGMEISFLLLIWLKAKYLSFKYGWK